MFKEYYSPMCKVFFGPWAANVEGNYRRLWINCFFDSHVHKFKYLNLNFFKKTFTDVIRANKKLFRFFLFREHLFFSFLSINKFKFHTIKDKVKYFVFFNKLMKSKKRNSIRFETYKDFKRLLSFKWLSMFRPFILPVNLFKIKSKIALYFLQQNLKFILWENKLKRDGRIIHLYSMLKNFKDIDVLNCFVVNQDYFIKNWFIRPYWLRPQGLKYFPPYNFLGLEGRFFLHRLLHNSQNLSICIIRISSRNVFITVINATGLRVICKQSAGSVGFKG